MLVELVPSRAGMAFGASVGRKGMWVKGTDENYAK
jgi:hypothetical protein